MRGVKAWSLRWYKVSPIRRLGGNRQYPKLVSDDSCHRAVPGVVPVQRSESCSSDTVHRSIALAETGLIFVLEGLVGECLRLVQLEAPFALRAGGLLVLAPVRCEPIWPSTNCVPMCAVGGCFRDTGDVYYLRHRVDHPKFLPQGLEVVLDDLSDLFGFVVFLTSMVRISAKQGCLLYVDLDSVASPAAQKLYCVQGETSASEHLRARDTTDVFAESL